MTDHVKTIRAVVSDLESIQRQVGQAQVELLNILTDDSQDEWDEPAQTALLKLEGVQRSIGEVQISLIEHLPIATSGSEPTVPAGASTGVEQPYQADLVKSTTKAAASVPATSTFVSPEAWLERRGIRVKSVPAANGMDDSADRAALFLGDNYTTLEPFYEALKKAVCRGYQESWFSLEDTPAATIGSICTICTILHGSGFLIRFKNLKRNPTYNPNQKAGIRFAPLQDPRVTRFFTGGWLERYVVQVVSRAAKAAFGRESRMPILREAQITLSTGCDRELDLIGGLPGGRVVWLECKTGDYRPFIPSLQDLNKRFLKLSPSDAALVLVEKLDDEQRASASVLTGMSAVHLTELNDWLTTVMSAKPS